MDGTRLLLLGSPQLLVDGKAVSLGRRKDLALLAYLAVTGERHSRETLSTLLWPDADESRGRAALRKAIYRFRLEIDDWLEVHREDIGIRAGFEVDVARFRQLVANKHASAAEIQEASNLYRGDFLAGFTLPDCPDFDRWQFFQAEELRSALIGGLETLVGQAVSTGQYDQGILASRRILSQDPLHEPAHQMLMQCYAWAGQRGAALRQYQECVQLLEEELGVEPSPETTQLYEQIKSHQLAAPATVEPAVPAMEPIFADLRTPGPLVGRQIERDQIEAMIEAAAAARGQLLLIDGEPGIGKSRLLQEAVIIARRRRVHSIWLNCYRVEQDIPYQPVAELIEQALASWPPETFRSLPVASLADLASLVPEAGNIALDLPVTPSALDEARRARLFRSLGQLIESLAKPEGLLLVFDDVHWADLATLQFLHYLTRRLSGQAVLLLCSFRSGDVASNRELATVLDALAREETGSTMGLTRLSVTETDQLVRTLVPTAGQELHRWLYRETDGNPLFVSSMLQAIPDELLTGDLLPPERDSAADLPVAMLESIRDRLRWLPEDQGRVLEFAAVIGRRFEFDLLQALTGESTLALLTTVESLVQRQLLREERDGRYDFTHDKIRDVIYQDLNHVRRRLLHKMVAEALERREAHRLREIAGTLSAHFEQAGSWDKAIHYLAITGDRASELYALQEASNAYQRALELADAHPDACADPDRLGLIRGRAQVRASLVDFEGAVQDFQEALKLAGKLERIDSQRESLLQLGMVYRRSDDYEQASSNLAEALAMAETADDERVMADILFHLGTVSWSQGDNRQATEWHERAVSIVERLSLADRVAMQAYHGRAEAYYMEGIQPEAERYFRRSLDLARQLGDKEYEAENLLMLGVVNSYYLGANYTLAREYGEQARAISQEYHFEWHLMPINAMLGVTLAATGAYQAGVELTRQAIQLAEARGNQRYRSVALINHGYLLLDLNLITEAIATFETAVAIAQPVNAGHPLLRARGHLAAARLRSGMLDASQELRDVLEQARRTKRGIVATHCLTGLAEWAILTGDHAGAADFAAQLLALAQAGHMREMIARAHLWLGESSRLSGDLAAAEEAFLLAAGQAEEIGRLRLSWDAHAALARLYAQRKRHDLAQGHESRVKEIVSAIAADLTEPDLHAGLPRYG